MHRTTAKCLALLLTTFTGILYAQGVTGTIAGTLTDPSGGRLAQATVRVVNELTGEQRSDTTNSAGDYIFPNLATGQYSVQAEATGFRKFTRQGIRLNVNQNARVDIQMEVGSLSQE